MDNLSLFHPKALYCKEKWNEMEQKNSIFYIVQIIIKLKKKACVYIVYMRVREICAVVPLFCSEKERIMR